MAGKPKGSPQNLTPFNKMDPEKKKAVQSKGGKAGAVSKRKRKAFKEALKTALTVVIDEESKKTVQDIGIDALMAKFMAGDPKVFELIRDTIGEKPTEKQEVKVVDSDWFV
jgi:hypothetical protein